MNAPAFTGGRWYAKRGVSQMVSMDTTIWSAPSQNTDGSRWFVFADADEHGENEATANLIAAAPELYEAAAAVAALYADEPEDELDPAWGALRAALAKAVRS